LNRSCCHGEIDLPNFSVKKLEPEEKSIPF
jgi:hypothetical protein